MKTLPKALPILRLFKNGGFKSGEDFVINEERVTFYLNHQKILSVMSIPDHQDAHILGFLMSEGVVTSIDEVKSISISSDGLSVNLEAKIQEENLSNLHQEKTLTSGCCVGVTANFEGKIIEKFLSSKNKISAQSIWKSLEYFENKIQIFKQTGCVHRAILFDNQGNMIFDLFDVGRHNAVDKIMGMRAMKKIDSSQCFLFVSGRLSLEMIIKVAMHEIPIVISKASTTKQAIQAAQKLGITLISFAREERCNIYTHPVRIEETSWIR